MVTWTILASLFFAGTVVASETWREYESWQDRPLGILDFAYGVAHQDLPPMPAWECDKRQPPRLADRVLNVEVILVGTAVNPYTDSQWEALLEERLGVPVRLHYGDLVGTIETAREIALADRSTVHLALQDGYFRGPNLNEKVEGMACTNLAIVNAGAECQEGVAAHEIGHVLGLSHSADGLMRARAAPCPATLGVAETAYLVANSRQSSPLGA